VRKTKDKRRRGCFAALKLLEIIIIWCSMDSSDELLKVIAFLTLTADYYYPDWACLVDCFAI